MRFRLLGSTFFWLVVFLFLCCIGEKCFYLVWGWSTFSTCLRPGWNSDYMYVTWLYLARGLFPGVKNSVSTKNGCKSVLLRNINRIMQHKLVAVEMVRDLRDLWLELCTLKREKKTNKWLQQMNVSSQFHWIHTCTKIKEPSNQNQNQNLTSFELWEPIHSPFLK